MSNGHQPNTPSTPYITFWLIRQNARLFLSSFDEVGRTQKNDPRPSPQSYLGLGSNR